ncbi:MAG: RDD family protein [Candidatus Eremiobacteraeota bacterium]|nr:RDD family protein [Candidatus Eremiobacteraeota bacterium]
MHELFRGRNSLREPSERIAFWLTAIFSLPVALAIGYLLHESIGASQAALFIVIAMVYVTLARGRLLGSSVRVHELQYPRVFAIVKRACAALEIPMPLIFVREDNYVPAVALGFGEPYALVLSSHWIELFADDELSFIIGRELGHIAAGHTRFHSLLSVNGNENPLVSLIFGAWLRRCALTCDKVGLLCCGTVDAAIRAMGIAAFHEFGRKVDYQAFAEQHAEIQNDAVLRLGEWLSSEPYATRRIASLRRFIASHSYAQAEAWFLRERSAEPPALAAPGETKVATRDCAGWWRRFAAYSIDVVVVTAIITSFGGSVTTMLGNRSGSAESASVTPGDVDIKAGPANITIEGKSHARPGIRVERPGFVWKNPAMRAAASPSPAPTATPETVGPFELTDQGPAIKMLGGDVPLSAQGFAGALGSAIGHLGFFFWFPLYLALLVVLAGQTFGMMIAGLRVVTVEFRRPSVARTIWRYFLAGLLWWLIFPLSFIWRRVLLHDRLTKTRVVKVERALTRA